MLHQRHEVRAANEAPRGLQATHLQGALQDLPDRVAVEDRAVDCHDDRAPLARRRPRQVLRPNLGLQQVRRRLTLSALSLGIAARAKSTTLSPVWNQACLASCLTLVRLSKAEI